MKTLRVVIKRKFCIYFISLFCNKNLSCPVFAYKYPGPFFRPILTLRIPLLKSVLVARDIQSILSGPAVSTVAAQ